MARDNALARTVLDSRLAALRDVAPTPPPRGWIRAIREALGMSQSDLGRRLGVSKQAVLQMEASEADGSIRLSTLRRGAEALGCTLVYAPVPDSSLEQTVDERAHLVASRDVDRARHTMLLEDQSTSSGDAERVVRELAEQAKSSRALWRD
jgi:predicted DNA-binding mobile mystery protein A